MKPSLIQKYNIPGPRYTSYPTVPYWDSSTFTKERWIKTFQNSFTESNEKEGISLYVHLPFCDSLCTFCACHKHITKQHHVEETYIDAVLKEWGLYLELIKEVPIIKEIHLGGGTPTFFSAKNLSRLINGILAQAKKHPDYEFSFEGHPNNTSKEHLQTLYNLGFTRVSFGVQDYNPVVQKAIHRMQPFENVQKVHHWAKDIGYTSISHDLVFGLPFQTIENVIHTINKTRELQPDRISFYSYAHVPWVKGVGQRGFNEKDLPKNEDKRHLYEVGKELLSKMGYVEIGMDHFALPTDSLYKATIDKTLHRNFMGYTANKTQLMIGLGMSAISDSWYGFSQNVKTVKEYQQLVFNGEIPVFRGHILSEEDLIIRQHVLNIMCQFSTSWDTQNTDIESIDTHLQKLQEMIDDDLVVVEGKQLYVPEHARPYVRNICMAFDKKLHEKQPGQKLFSMTI